MFFKINRDHQDILDIGLRDLVFRFFQVPKRSGTGWEWSSVPSCIFKTLFEKNVTPLSDIPGFGIDVHETDL